MEPMSLDDALSELLPDGRTGDLAADLRAAAHETWRRRQVNGTAGGVVFGALLSLPSTEGGMTTREIADELGTSKSTISRWATPPPAPDETAE